MDVVKTARCCKQRADDEPWKSLALDASSAIMPRTCIILGISSDTKHNWASSRCTQELSTRLRSRAEAGPEDAIGRSCFIVAASGHQLRCSQATSGPSHTVPIRRGFSACNTSRISSQLAIVARSGSTNTNETIL